MADITLSTQQQDALSWLVTKLYDEQAALVSLKGYAGCGKSVLMTFLRDALVARGLQVSIGAPTHRAAMILRQKGLEDANTVHALALSPVFTADYTQALRWLGEDRLLPDGEEPHEDVEGLPWLVHEAVSPAVARGRDLRRQRQQYPAKRLLASVGIHGKDFFAGFRPRLGEGVLLLDEASMVGTAMLALCQRAFTQVCLIGDPGQLPPVKDTAQLASVDGYTLTEIHRQAADSPIIQLAHRARNGEAVWQERLSKLGDEAGDILECASADASVFLTSPLIVWRNSTRLDCTKAIRTMLGYPATSLAVGEPLVCRSTDREDRALGLYNNGLFVVTAIDAGNPRALTIKDALGEEQDVLAHLEELDGTSVDPKAVPFRFGYALTAHTAQGGEWSTVYISLPDLKAYAAFAQRQGRQEEIAQWAYTAITRAKQTLCFLTQHRFTTPQEEIPMAEKRDRVAPPSAPMMTEAPASPLETAAAMHDADPGILDDIPDPRTPPSVTAAIETPPIDVQTIMPTSPREDAVLHAFIQRQNAWLTAQHKYSGDFMDSMLNACKRWMETMIAQQERESSTLAQTLTTALAQGLQVTGSPYAVTVQALSPQGYVVAFRVEKGDAGSLVDEVQRLTAWLAAQQYTAMPNAVAF